MKRIFTAIIALFSIGWLAAQIVVRTETGIYFLPIASVDSVTFMSHPKRYEFFSVGAGKYVAFSPGNLQYSGVKSGNYRWSFAAHQYDCIGAANVDNGALADKIDLFGWSADNTTAPWGISTSTTTSDYSGDFVDWGTNAIGQDAANTWRTLSSEEWGYLFNSRTDASSKYGVARINLNADGSKYMNGVIVLPDTWTCPSGITFKSGVASSKGEQYYADYQTFTLSQWEQLEQSGAVFLPAAGYRLGTNVGNVQVSGSYRSSTADGADNAYYVYFRSDRFGPKDSSERSYGRAVRLVQDLATYTITCNATTHGSLSADKAISPRGGKVTITAKPDEGYAVQSLTVLQGTKVISTTFSGSNTYTFTMPAGDVEVTAVYKTITYSVSASKQVYFASGNLQYQASTDTWRFAEHQYDFADEDNNNISDTYDGWIDLFGWGTGDSPTKTSGNNSDYATFTDWGTNVIGTYSANTWRTLSGEEWGYLFNGRANASSLYGFAMVNGIRGLILLPDDWTLPSGISFHAGKADFKKNDYTLVQWEEMESAGAVFLPAAGYRYGHSLGKDPATGAKIVDKGYYQASTAVDSEHSYRLYFCGGVGGELSPQDGGNRYYGRSVRLVKEW